MYMARLASFKMEQEEEFDPTRWLDRALIRLASRFGDFRKVRFVSEAPGHGFNNNCNKILQNHFNTI